MICKAILNEGVQWIVISPKPIMISFLAVQTKPMALGRYIALVAPFPAFLDTSCDTLNLLVGGFGGIEWAKERMIFHSAPDSCHQVD